MINTEIEKGFLPRTGAQFFVNPDDTYEDTVRHIELMKEYGIRLVRLFVLWEHVEPKENQWDFSRYDTVYDLAEKTGIKIVSTLTSEDPPQWYEEKPFFHHYSNLNSEKLKEYSARYIEKLVSRYHQHPAHYAWILMNEPEVKLNYEADTMQEFAKWLEKQYGTIENMNAKWYKQFNHFNEVSINPNDQGEYWQCFPAFVDWHCFLKSNLVDQLSWIKSEVQKIDTTSPVHLNPKGFFGNLAPVGQDYWKENEVSDILGASIHPAWKFLWFEREDYGIAFSFCTDMIRSASNGKSFWVTELQSGPTLMTGIQPCTPSPQELSAWVWDAFGAGAKSVVYWMWHPRTYGQEAGEWGIVTANHKVSKRLIASSEVTNVIEENEAVFKNACVEKPKVAILYNHATEILSLIEGSPLYRTQEATIQSLVGAYKALMLANIPVNFISADQIIQGGLKSYAMIYLPYSYALDSDVQEHIKEFVYHGGKLWAETPCGWKDSYGGIHRKQPLREAFGIEMLENRGCSIDPKENEPYLSQADLEIETADVISSFSDGSPAITKNSYGKGEAYFVSTTASLGYFHTKNMSYARQISDFAEEYQSGIVRVSSHNGHIIQRILKSDEGIVLILENWSKESNCTIDVLDSRISKVKNLITKEFITLANYKINLTMQQNETVVLLLKS